MRVPRLLSGINRCETSHSRPAADEQQGQHRSSSGFANFSRNDIFRRIEDDRERVRLVFF